MTIYAPDGMKIDTSRAADIRVLIDSFNEMQATNREVGLDGNACTSYGIIFHKKDGTDLSCSYGKASDTDALFTDGTVRCRMTNGPDLHAYYEELSEAITPVRGISSNILAPKDLRWFAESFFNDTDFPARLRNAMLQSEYDKCLDVDLSQLFYDGVSGSGNVSDEERAALAAVDPMAETLDITKVTAAEMTDALDGLIRQRFDTCNQVGLENFTYLSEFDAYYIAHGDTNFAFVTMLSGERTGDDRVTLHYEQDTGRRGCVTLREVDGEHVFVSNVWDTVPLFVGTEAVTSIYLRWGSSYDLTLDAEHEPELFAYLCSSVGGTYAREERYENSGADSPVLYLYDSSGMFLGGLTLCGERVVYDGYWYRPDNSSINYNELLDKLNVYETDEHRLTYNTQTEKCYRYGTNTVVDIP